MHLQCLRPRATWGAWLRAHMNMTTITWFTQSCSRSACLYCVASTMLVLAIDNFSTCGASLKKKMILSHTIVDTEFCKVCTTIWFLQSSYFYKNKCLLFFFIFAHYSSIILNPFSHLLFSKLCQHNYFIKAYHWVCVAGLLTQ